MIVSSRLPVPSRVEIASYKPTSMIGLCQEGKSSPDALRRSAGTKLFLISRRVCWPLSRGSFFQIRTRLPFAVSDQRVVLNRRLSLCFPASLETYQRGHPQLALFRPVGLTARPGRHAPKKSSMFIATLYAAMQLLVSAN